MKDVVLTVVLAISAATLGLIEGHYYAPAHPTVPMCDRLAGGECTAEQWQAWDAEAWKQALHQAQNAVVIAKLREEENLIVAKGAQARTRLAADAQAYENEKLEGSIHDKGLLKGWQPEMNGSWAAEKQDWVNATGITVSSTQGIHCIAWENTNGGQHCVAMSQ